MALVRFQRRPLRNAFTPFPANPVFDELENRMRNMFDDSFTALDNDIATPLGWLPATDISETPEALLLTAELPGLDRGDVDISIDDGILTIRGEKADEKVNENKKFLSVERTFGTFQRSFTLPRTVDVTKINAEFGKGVLTIMMPKTVEAKAKGRKIEVQDKK